MKRKCINKTQRSVNRTYPSVVLVPTNDAAVDTRKAEDPLAPVGMLVAAAVLVVRDGHKLVRRRQEVLVLRLRKVP